MAKSGLCGYLWLNVVKSGLYVVKSGFMWLKVVPCG